MSKQQTIANVLENLKKNRLKSFENHSPVLLRIHRIHDHLHHNLNQIIAEYKLQEADFFVLETLRRDSESSCLSPTELYCAMLFSSGGLTKVLSRVTSAGLVERIDNPNDKRSKLVKLTEVGKVLIDNITQELNLSDQKKMSVLSKQEQEQLNMLLAKLLSVWE